MATRIANATAIAGANGVVDQVDLGAPASTLEVRTGAQPADPDTAATGTVLATFDLPDPCFGNAADAAPGGRATANAITNVTASASGTAGWFRVYDGNGAAVLDGSCGTSGQDMNFDNDAIALNGTVSITSWTVTLPET